MKDAGASALDCRFCLSGATVRPSAVKIVSAGNDGERCRGIGCNACTGILELEV
jgi:hypothetical protein